jgi:Ca2+-binding RTX toxin-like protein
VDDGQGGTSAETAVVTVEGKDEVITGTEDNDVLEGTSGNDIISALGDDDTIFGSVGSDVIDGGEGRDLLDYSGLDQAVTVDLAAGTASSGDDVDQISNIERVAGTSFDDTLKGSNASSETFIGLAGNDLIQGGGGYVDIASYAYDASTADSSGSFGTAGVTVNLETGVAIDGYGDTDTLVNIDGAAGTEFVDVMTGSSASSEVFIGLAGSDIIDGGRGNDWVDYRFDAEFGGTLGVTVNLAEGFAVDGFGDTDDLTSIERVWGTNQDDVFIGNDVSNRFRGLGGVDTYEGGGGGGDTIDFSSDYRYGGNLGVNVDLVAGTATDGFGNLETFTSIESARGGAYDDNINGLGSYSALMGFAGDDVISNGWADYSNDMWYTDGEGNNGYSGVFVDLAAGTAIDGFGDTDTLINIDTAWGSIFDDVLIGNANDGELAGLAGNDFIDGGAGRDQVLYNLDRYFARLDSSDFGTNGVTVDLAEGYAIDGFGDTDTLVNIEDIVASEYDDVLTGDGGNNAIHGKGGNDQINGGGGDDYLNGQDGDDVISGGGGFDGLEGGSGSDTAVFSGALAEYTFAEGWAPGIIEVTDSIYSRDGTASLSNIESLQFSDGTISIDDAPVIPSLFTDGDDVIDFNNVVAGTYAEGSQYDAQGGNDTVTLASDQAAAELAGYQTWNWFNAGDGDDTVHGSEQRDTFSGNSGNDFLYGYGGDDHIAGDDGNDYIDGGEGNDWLEGWSGNDTIIGGAGDDGLIGGAGDDVLDGGAGDWDSVRYDFEGGFAGVTVNLETGTAHDGHGGTDTLLNIEVIDGSDYDDVLTGDANGNGIWGHQGNDIINGGAGEDLLDGQEGDDTLSGGAGNDWLTGGNGNDVIVGGADNDSLFGGAGDDLFIFTNGNGDNAIHDFTAGQGSEDVIDLSGFDFNDLSELAMMQQGSELRIQLDGDDAISLLGVNIADLHADDFIF